MSDKKVKRKCRNCRDEVSITCGEGKIYAPCIGVEYDFPDFSSLLDEDGDPITCATLDDVVEDIYTILEEWQIDLTDFEVGCLDFETEDLTPEIILQKHNDVICEMLTDIEELKDVCNTLDKNITECGLDTTCLIGVDECNNPVPLDTLKDVLQALINKHCPNG